MGFFDVPRDLVNCLFSFDLVTVIVAKQLKVLNELSNVLLVSMYPFLFPQKAHFLTFAFYRTSY